MVRQAFKKRLKKFAEKQKIKFHDTLNRDTTDIKDPTWISATFYANDRENVGYSEGQPFIETGVCTVFIFVRANTGDDEVIAVADKLQDEFNNNSGNFESEKVSVTKIEPPLEAYEGDTRKWFSMYVGLDYLFSR